MQTLRSRLALLLLLCFTRVLLPEAWILNLHSHEHTTEEPAQIPGAFKGKAVLSVKHQHCDVDHFYDVPFQPAPPVELPVLVATYQAASATPETSVWLSATRSTADQRGPPCRS
ncbi:hypothetical protein [Hymenobacter psychrotolerans]|uniref:Uncharacterized protein n=1 Tax=Hymenobacter psychrotolerans DSM 18569 TaxID=1121959 RepID=A0A1M6PBK4_9BACT|nr:hypothetical protein [Hymenobacter psychrotolerans]SHK05250.1 hypothetical protein SAMN02746009_00183 [Hymenobacter psychrotolerans DSM 18569]